MEMWGVEGGDLLRLTGLRFSALGSQHVGG